MRRLALFAALAVTLHASAATVTKTAFGRAPNGSAAELYTLTEGDTTVSITNFGARIVSIRMPDNTGAVSDIALGYDTIDGYIADRSSYFGSVVGRYGNRIAKGAFTLNGKQYQIPTNDNGNALHGGTEGFDRKLWTATPIADGVEFTVVSPAGDMGFPGTLTAHVKYVLMPSLFGASLKVTYDATTDAPTVLNLTNHTYFNLNRPGTTILDQKIRINADKYTPVDANLIPTGIESVAKTPMDFRKAHTVGDQIDNNFAQIQFAKGYDHNYVLNGEFGEMKVAALVTSPTTGRSLLVTTTEPGVQFYTGNFLDGTTRGHDNVLYPRRGAICLETQHYPDSPNHPAFPTTTLKPGKAFHSVTIFEFRAGK